MTAAGLPDSRPSPQQLHQAVRVGLRRCTATQFSDAEAVASLASALDRWVSEYPDQAQDVELLSLSASYTATRCYAADAVVQLAAAGRVASLIRPRTTPADQASATLLALLAAESNLALGHWRDGQLLLDDAGRALREPESLGLLAPYFVHRFELLSGSFSEAALDASAASPHFARALEAGEPLLRNRVRLRSLARQWVPMVFGPAVEHVESGDEQAIGLLKDDLLRCYRKAQLGYARTADDRAAAARGAVDALIEFGLPDDVSTLELRPALLALPPEDTDTRFAALIEKAGELNTGQRRAAWTAMIRMARARVLSQAGGGNPMADIHDEVAADLAQGADALTWAGAFGDMLATSKPSENTVHPFLMTYGRVSAGEPGASLPLPLRVQFDDAIGAISAWAFDRLSDDPTPDSRRLLSLALDALRSPEVDELSFVAGADARATALDGPLKDGYDAALDRLGRLDYAIAQRPDSCAIAMQTHVDATTFVCATGDAHAGLLTATAGREYQDAARALAHGLADAIREPTLDTTDRITALGRAAFQALPLSMRELLQRRQHVYLLPDFHADRDGVPFELFHDGSDFLCLTRVVSRSLSLRELLRTVEPAVVQQDIRQRAVCLAVPQAVGLEPLQYADLEVRAVRETLGQWSWDAPDLSTTSLTASRLLDAIALAGVTHIAAHGTVSAGGEALILNDGSILTVDDIIERPRLLPGLIFLNACSLGRIRYLGAGLTSGIASAFVRAGAPCVVANLLPVEDQTAADFAAAFYAAAQHHSTGEALRQARRALADRGTPPSRWGTTILLGDPEFRIAGREAHRGIPREPAAGLLYRYSVPDETLADHARAIRSARRLLEREPRHVRLRGAIDWATASAGVADTTPDRNLGAARVARALDCRPGESLFLFTAARALTDPTRRRRTLDDAIWALEPLTPLNGVWRRMHIEVSAERQKLDARREIPFIGGPLRINDPDDPATQALLQIQHAVDRRSIREQGPLPLRQPERTLADVTWNAIVLGQQNRFEEADAQAGFAMQMARKLTLQGLIAAEMEDDVRRVLGGLLSFLWEKQRITHLVRELALGQASTMRLMVERIGNGWDESVRWLVQPLIPALDRAGDGEGGGDGNKFLRALDALNAVGTPSASAADIEAQVRDTLDRCGAISPRARAEAAAWSIGLLLEHAHQCARSHPPRLATRDRLLRVHLALYSEVEGWLFPYLVDGFERVRESSHDFVWRWMSAADAPAPTPPRGRPAGRKRQR